MISASPSPTATRFPSPSTVTTDSSEEVKVISPASSGSNSASILSSSPTNNSKELLPLILIDVSIIDTVTDTSTSAAASYISLPLKLITMVASPSPTALTLPSLSTSTISSALSSSSLATLYSKESKRSNGIISEPSSIIMYAIIFSSSPTFNSKVSLLISSIRTLFLETLTFTTVSEGLYILFPAKLIVISASPSPTATRLPLASTVTTDSSDEVKIISPASLGMSSASILSSSPTYKLKESS